MTAVELCWALVRTTLATSATACLAALLLARLKIHSPRIHRAAWAMVVLQGWLLVPWTFEVQTPTPEAPRLAPVADAPSAGVARPWSLPKSTRAIAVDPAPVAPIDGYSPAILAWIAGAAVLVLVASWRYVRIIRTLPLGSPLDDPQWQHQWRRQRVAMGVHGRVDFRLTDRLGPLVAYIPFAYLLLAPRSVWTALDSRERVAILRHELAHIRRHDLWKSLALRVLALPQWFNPLVWLAVRRFDEAAEWACDAAACGPACDSPAVASALVHTAELIAFDNPKHGGAVIFAVPAGAASRRSSTFSRRIRRLVISQVQQESTMRKLIIPMLLAVVAGGQMFRLEYVAAKPAAEPAKGAATPSAPTPAEPASRDMPLWRKVATTSPATPAEPAADADPAKRKEYVESIWPRYIIEPPDILSIEGVKLVPKAPHLLEPFDVVLIRVQGALPEQPIDDTYSVDADGSVNLGPSYGRIKIAGDTIEAAEKRLREELAKKLPDVSVSASLVASAGAQQISGQHLVAMDGRVNLGVYGSVYVAGMTIEEARSAIEKMLSAQLEQPKVAVDVLAYNSKVYYVIYKSPKLGDNVSRMPITGNETVLDAVASMGGLSSIASNTMWVARPAPNGVGPEQILPVAWNDIARGESSKTNYQLMPGDRLFIETLPPVEKPQTPPTPASRVGDLQVHDVITVLVDYPAAAEDRRPLSFRIACEIKDIRPNGNLQIEGNQKIRSNNEEWQISLSGEVRRETILPDRTVSSRSVANLNVKTRVISAESAPSIVTIVLRQNGGETLMDQPHITGKKIGAVLAGAVYPTPINFAEAAISLERLNGDEAKAWAIGWDASRSRPAEDDDRVLEPGDRIVVTAPGYVPLPEKQAADQTSSPYHLTDDVQYYQPATREEPSSPALKGAKQSPEHPKSEIAFDVSFLQDPQGTLADFGDLAKTGAMIGDTRTTRSALQVLEKNKLINSAESPPLVCEIGDGVEFTGPHQTTGEHASIKVHTRRLDEKHLVVGVSVTQDGRTNRVENVVDRTNPETTIMRLDPPSGPSDNQAKHGVYVVVTPQVTK